ncbi:Y-family DNA polymerase [Stutzerimonas nitrititolerans]|uniref:Y-family DNA polymerase n=1 Tax=Stutzerimonas nitrititolerans TaxID=2482751 RepID=UPI00289F0C60|nr:Y-family DNA polymerase [Stutzerimonas nitrititolerans]
MPEAILKPSWRLRANQKRVYALVDCNSFYASCERHPLWRPDLAGQAIVVLSNNDGCVIARSAEAKKLGYKMGDPFFKIRDQLAEQGVHVFSSNYTLYDDLSNRVMMTLADMVPELEVYSIDEMFADLTGIPGLQSFGEELRNRVWNWVGIHVGVGISTTKTLSKLSNWAAKNWKGLGGVAVVLDDQRHELLLKRAPIDEVWGAGRRYAERLKAMGIDTAWHLACCDDQQIGKDFGVLLRRTVLELRGLPCAELQLEAPPKKNIVSSRAFSSRQKGWQPVEQSIASYVARAAEKLRAQGSVCRRIDVGLIVRTATQDSFQDTWSIASAKVSTHTDDTLMLQGAAINLAKRIFDKEAVYAKSSIALGEICQPSDLSQDMFALAPTQSEVSRVLDSINTKFGKGALRTGVTVGDASWSMQRGHLSPYYTTRLADLPKLR